jgi:hypothetical protein
MTGRIGLALVLAFGLATGAAAEVYKGTETPAYRVEQVLNGAEVRAYGPAVVAEVTVGGSRSGAANAGFRVLAGYIFGGNDDRTKIAMTTPVAQVPDPAPISSGGADAREWTIRFTMPAKWSVDSLPAAKDSRIRMIETAPRRMLVVTFSGRPTDAALAEALEQLRATAEKTGLQTTGAPEYMFYDAPFTLPWNRRNEVALVLR